MINWTAIRKLIKGSEMMQEAQQELDDSAFVLELEDEIARGRYTVRGGHLLVKTSHAPFEDRWRRQELLRYLGYTYADSDVCDGFRGQILWTIGPKEE